jgi:DNA-binding transcriptional regulator YiaG
MAKQTKKDRALQKLLERIEAVRKRDKMTIADFARELGLNYIQVYKWLVSKRNRPDGVTVARLYEWLEKRNKIRKLCQK